METAFITTLVIAGQYIGLFFALAVLAADSDRSRPGFPRRSRPLFRNDAGHRSEMKPATQLRF